MILAAAAAFFYIAGLVSAVFAAMTARTAQGAIAWTLAQAGWSWGPFVLHALGYRDTEMPPRRGAGPGPFTRLTRLRLDGGNDGKRQPPAHETDPRARQ